MLFAMRSIVSLAALAGIFMFAPAAHALESAWADGDKARVRLLAAGLAPDGTLRAGVEIRMARGWHTYWRYPGDAGVPPRFEWSGSRNITGVEVRWPAPKRIRVEGGLQSIGYYDSVVLPLRIRPLTPGQPISLRLKLDFGVCEKICIPAEATVELTVPPQLKAGLPALDAAEARVPRVVKAGPREGLAVLALRRDRAPKPRALIDVAVPRGGSFDLFAEGPTDAWALPLPERIEGRDGRARFVVPFDEGHVGSDPFPATLRLVLVAGDEAIEVEAPLD
jgi:DsbC/DsbD-like thiol-disulfide interchange protein